MRQIDEPQRRKECGFRLRTPDAWLVMAVARRLSEEQQQRGQNGQKNLLMAENAHVAEIQ